MCSRFTQYNSREEYPAFLGEEAERDILYDPEPIGRYNVAPGTQDEAFLKVTGIDAYESYLAFGQRVSATVRQCDSTTVRQYDSTTVRQYGSARD